MSRESRIVDQMDLLGIKDVSTPRQCRNGTVVWRLPIKNEWNNGSFIEVASFKTGYVRNNNSGYSNYQLNKRCDSEPDYYKIERNGETLYRKFTTRTCVLIPKEIDRLEYLIAYCLKNYYIKKANEVVDTKRYTQKLINELQDIREHRDYPKHTWSGGQITDNETGEVYVHEQHAYWNKIPNSVQVIVDGHRYKIK